MRGAPEVSTGSRAPQGSCRTCESAAARVGCPSSSEIAGMSCVGGGGRPRGGTARRGGRGPPDGRNSAGGGASRGEEQCWANTSSHWGPGGFCAARGISQPVSVGARASGERGDQPAHDRLGAAIPPYRDHHRYRGHRLRGGGHRQLLRGSGRGQLAREVGNSRIRHRTAGAGGACGEPVVGSGRARPGRRGIPPARTLTVHGDRRTGARRDRPHLAQHQALDLRRDPRDRAHHHDRAVSAAPLAAQTAEGRTVPETGARCREPGHRARPDHPNPQVPAPRLAGGGGVHDGRSRARR